MAWEWLLGRDPEKYKADPNASTTNGAYGATQFAQGQMQGAQGRPAQQAGQAVTGQAAQLTDEQAQFRQRQMGLADQLSAAAQGQGPSASGMAAQAARGSNLAQAAALQAGRRGASAASGIRQSMNAATMGNQAIAQQEQIGRAQEIATARGQLGDVLGQGRGMDINFAGQNAGFRQQMGLANMDAQNRRDEFNAGLRADQGRANDAYSLGNAGLLAGLSQAEMQARMEQERIRAGNLDPGSGGIGAGLINIGTTLGAAALSDRNAKQGVNQSGWSGIVNALAGGVANMGAAYAARKQMQKEDAADRKREEEEKAEKLRKEREVARVELEKMRDGVPDQRIYLRSAGTPYVAQPAPIIPSPYVPTAAMPSDAMAPRITSDELSKDDIRAVRGLVDSLKAYSYEYRDDADMPPGRHVGVMAQDVEKTRLGKQFVGRDEETGYRTVDYGRMLPALAAGVADINGRLRKVEGKKGR